MTAVAPAMGGGATSVAPIFEAADVSVHFGGLKAVDGVSLQVKPGEVLGIIGPNGAGKSTLFEVLSGFVRPNTGRVFFDGRDVTDLRPDQRARMGVMRTFQIPKPFSSLTVLDNVAAARSVRDASLAEAKDNARSLLARLGMADRERETAGQLPNALKKRLELARALAGDPKVLLLDEVLAGLTAKEIGVLIGVIRTWADEESTTIVLIEHVLRAVRSLCGRVIAIAEGRILAEGDAESIMQDERVIAEYLGRPLNEGR